MPRFANVLPGLAVAMLLAGCASHPKPDVAPSGETFDADDTYSRSYESQPAQACEAAQRALLGQGYVVSRASGEGVEASKNFQPDAETHTQLVVRVTCMQHRDGGALVFVNAVQDRYALKKTSSSASLGVGVLGSVSLPVGSSDDSLVKVASNTVQNQAFYRRFFDRVKYYMPSEPDRAAAPPPPEPAAPPDPQSPAAVPDPQPAQGPA
ncbi:MAG: DUF2242 domain-containing protein [Luteimonas sp.]|nr:DUF2242 domain-containing protein [Luteimonas sp.]